MQSGIGRVRHMHRVIHGDSVEAGAQFILDAHAHVGVVAIAREVDEHGCVPSIVVGAHEDLHLPSLIKMDDRGRELDELIGVHREELIAREGLDQLAQITSSMRIRRDFHRVEHPQIPRPQHRNGGDALGIRGSCVQAKESTLADHCARRVKELDAHVVEVAGAMHGHPAQQRGALAGVINRPAGIARGLKLGRKLLCPGLHERPVGDRGTDIAQCASQMVCCLAIVVPEVVALHLNLDPGLNRGARRARVIGLDVEDLEQATIFITTHHQLRVQDQSRISSFDLQRPGQGVHKEGHVIDHDGRQRNLRALKVMHLDIGPTVRTLLGRCRELVELAHEHGGSQAADVIPGDVPEDLARQNLL